MTQQLLIIVLFAISILTSCNVESTENGNNAIKIEVPQGMMVHMNAAFELIENAQAADHPDYTILAAELQSSNNEFISSCTMTGEDHNQLHAWLNPYMAALTDFAEAKTDDDQKTQFAEVVKFKESFFQSFKEQ